MERVFNDNSKIKMKDLTEYLNDKVSKNENMNKGFLLN
jgi:hypothetical protein